MKFLYFLKITIIWYLSDHNTFSVVKSRMWKTFKNQIQAVGPLFNAVREGKVPSKHAMKKFAET